MRALAKDPDQRYSSAEEMDADLARVARGAAVSHETEEAMTQVLSGAGVELGADDGRPARRASRRRRPRRPPTGRRSYYETRRATARAGRSLLGLLAVAIAAVGGYLLYNKINAAINKNRPVTVIDVGGIEYKNAELKLTQLGLKSRLAQRRATRCSTDFVISQDPNAGVPVPKGAVVTLTVSSGKPKTTRPAPPRRRDAATGALRSLQRRPAPENPLRPLGQRRRGSVTATAPGRGPGLRRARR